MEKKLKTIDDSGIELMYKSVKRFSIYKNSLNLYTIFYHKGC
jgi:hypothetical protein